MNRKNLTLIFFLSAIVFVHTSTAQTLNWASASSSETYRQYSPDFFGKKYLISEDVTNKLTHIRKIDSDSTIIWHKTVRGTGVHGGKFVFDQDGSIYFAQWLRPTGVSKDSVYFDPGPGSTNVLIDRGFSFIAKYDSSGAFQWVKVMRNEDQSVLNFTIDNQKNLLLTGRFYKTADFDPGPGSAIFNTATSSDYLAKYDSGGNLIYAVGEDGTRLAKLDHAGNIFIMTEFRDSLDIEPGTGSTMIYGVNTGNVSFTKYDGQLNIIWNKIYGSDRIMHANGFDTDAYGNLYINGEFRDSADFEPGPGVTKLYENSSAIALYILKLDANGDFAWVKHLQAMGTGGVYSNCIVNKVTGEVYILGHLSGTLSDFDPGPATVNIQPESSHEDFFVAKYNKNGDYQWVIHIVGGYFYDILDLGNSVFCVGAPQQSSDVDVDSDPNGKYMLQQPIAGMVANYKTPVSISSVHKRDIDLEVFPNPVSSGSIIINTGKPYNYIHAIISDIGGKVIDEFEKTNIQRFSYNTDNLTPGVYLLNIQTATGSTVVKFIKS